MEGDRKEMFFVDWLDKAANNAKDEQKRIKEAEERIQKINEAYPDCRMQLWIEFQNVFKEIQEKFGTEVTHIEAHENTLNIKIADVTIHAIAEQQILLGGYYASVNLSYNVSGSYATMELPYSPILLNGDGKWIYLDRSKSWPVSKEFGKEQIGEIFKSALQRYL